MKRFTRWLSYSILLACSVTARAEDAAWTAQLEARLEALDRETPGELGVWVKSLADGAQAGHRADRAYYLSSTIKVPVAIVVLKKVETGAVSLDQELTLQASDIVDGTGEIQGQQPGAQLSVAYLLEKMLVQSDSTAADMLIRLVGVEQLNDFLKQYGFGPATTILQVRYDAYGELHPRARELTNMDYHEIRQAGAWEARQRVFAEKVGVSPAELEAPSLTEAFERYYRRGLNSASLVVFGELLEKLVKGSLLSEHNTALVLRHMEAITTGDHRIRAGLPKEVRFAHKTGTQIRRMCNMGVAQPQSPDAVIIAACVEGYPSESEAEAVLERVGKAVADSGVLGSSGP
ncbi:MAG TPA: serine hydrolase [Acidobacteriota bacterium]|jgi:beta-lactamase class A